MLVLTRRRDEAVTMTGTGRVIVLGVQGDKVRLGFVAADDVRIVRDELLPSKDEKETA